jgi:tetratricopeptide (TPR) repeat protein
MTGNSSPLVFLAYRKRDGARVARWLDAHLNKRPLSSVSQTDATANQSVIEVFFDERNPTTDDFAKYNQPALHAAGAMILVCTPGVAADLSEAHRPDWLYEELNWWTANRCTPPILIDTTGEGTRWLPKPIKERYPEYERIQRLEFQIEEWEKLPPDEAEIWAERFIARIIPGIIGSDHSIGAERLEQEIARARELESALNESRSLSRQLEASLTQSRLYFWALLVVFLLAGSAGAIAIYQRNKQVQASHELASERQRQLNLSNEHAAELRRQYERVDLERSRADHHFELASEAVNEYTTIVQHLSPDQQELKHTLLRSPIRFFEKLSKQEPSSSTVRFEQGRAHWKLADFAADDGSPADALHHYKAAVDIFDPLSQAHPTATKYRDHLSSCLANLGNHYLRLHDFTKARGAYARATALRDSLCKEEPANIDFQESSARLKNYWGALASYSGDLPSAHRLFADAVGEYRSLVTAKPTDEKYSRELANVLSNLAQVAANINGPAEGEKQLGEALRICEQLHEKSGAPENTIGLAKMHLKLGDLLLTQGRRAEAEEHFQGAIELAKTVTKLHPKVTKYQETLADCQSGLADFYAKNNNSKLAEKSYQEVARIYEAIVARKEKEPDYREALGQVYASLGTLYLNFHHYAGAVAHMRRSVGILQGLHSDFPGHFRFAGMLATGRHKLGIAYYEAGEIAEARDEFRSVGSLWANLVDVAAGKGKEEQRQIQIAMGQSLDMLATLCGENGQPAEAQEHHRAAIQILERCAAANLEDKVVAIALAGTYCNKANVHRYNGEATESLQWYAKAEAILVATNKAKDGTHDTAQTFLRNVYWGRARVLDRLGKYAESLKDWTEAWQLEGSRPGSPCRAGRAVALARLGNHREAAKESLELSKIGQLPDSTLVEAIRALSLSSAAAMKDQKLSQSDAAALSSQYRQEARAPLATLVKSARLPAESFKEIAEHKDFTESRSDPGFNKLLQSFPTARVERSLSHDGNIDMEEWKLVAERFQSLGNYSEAIRHWDRALGMARKANPEKAGPETKNRLAHWLYRRGTCYFGLEKYALAVRDFEEALRYIVRSQPGSTNDNNEDLYAEISSKRDKSLGILSQTELLAGNFGDAILQSRKISAEEHRATITNIVAERLYQRGFVFLDQNNYAQALVYWSKAIDILNEVPSLKTNEALQHSLAKNYQARGTGEILTKAFEKANVSYMHSYELYEKLGHKGGFEAIIEAACCLNLSAVALESLKRFDLAIGRLKDAEKTLTDLSRNQSHPKIGSDLEIVRRNLRRVQLKRNEKTD